MHAVTCGDEDTFSEMLRIKRCASRGFAALYGISCRVWRVTLRLGAAPRLDECFTSGGDVICSEVWCKGSCRAANAVLAVVHVV